ncbi:MAG: hypothetical protein SPI74_05780 [Eubacterium sp.]|nr:hypothetical protein [Eubacterium sp.]
MSTMKIIIGLIIILASFIFLIKNHDKSLIDKMMDKANRNMKQKEKELDDAENDASNDKL